MRFYERNFLWLDLFLVAAFTASLAYWGVQLGGEERIDAVLRGNRAAVYGTAAAILGTMLGFLLTAVSILLGMWPQESLTLLRESDHGTTLWTIMKSGMRWLALATVLILGLLVFDRDGAGKPALFYASTFAVAIALMRVGRAVWVFEYMIGIITKSRSKEART